MPRKIRTTRCRSHQTASEIVCQQCIGIVRHSTLWLRPEAVAQIAFLEWTDHLRHTKFVALRDDKDPKKVVRET
jgi:ATP-dependent DNA ligase